MDSAAKRGSETCGVYQEFVALWSCKEINCIILFNFIKLISLLITTKKKETINNKYLNIILVAYW